ncbi:hypothetical protein C5167_012936 [Papaver somniferum]|uniref:Uncharacterized protein n=1 Tax=Papaver somniferum TaxID=3469 RepID=A0A4Y7IZP5_PAPSO|nr:hypothetical protein C5167_012936 [Papaver somniferum]
MSTSIWCRSVLWSISRGLQAEELILQLLGWGMGFHISSLFMIDALIVFSFGTKTYCYDAKEKKANPLQGVIGAFTVAAKN